MGVAGRRRLLRATDLLGGATVWWLTLRPAVVADPTLLPTVTSLLAFGLLWLLTVEGAEAYPPEAHGRGARRSPALLLGPAVVTGGLVLLLHVAVAPADPLALPTWPAAAGFLAGLVALPGALRLLLRPLLTRPDLRPGVLVVGTGPAAGELADVVREEGAVLYRVLGFVALDEGHGSRDAGGEAAGPRAEEGGAAPVLGTLADLERLVDESGADVVALGRRSTAAALGERPISACVERGVEIVALGVLVEELTGRVPVKHLEEGSPALPLAPPGVRPGHRAVKRCLDLALVAIGLVFFLPAVPFIAAAIRLETPGPVFFTQARIGRGGREFRMYKFRSMVADAEASGAPRWAEEDDPRITRVGAVLRGLHLDEFPQMLNILKGEMSPIGPRPERPEFVEQLEDRIPYYRMRHAVRPGMAGWALVGHGYASSLEEAREKHEYDLYYVKHQSVWLDLVVLARTLVDSFSLGGR